MWQLLISYARTPNSRRTRATILFPGLVMPGRAPSWPGLRTSNPLDGAARLMPSFGRKSRGRRRGALSAAARRESRGSTELGQEFQLCFDPAIAVRASPGQRSRALFAELRPGTIRVLAPGTLHAASSKSDRLRTRRE